MVRPSQHSSARHEKVNSRNIISKITYNPAKHKQRITRKLRKNLQEAKLPQPKPVTQPPTLKFGSFNVNGLDLETALVVSELLKTQGFDVSLKQTKNYLKNIYKYFVRSWL